MSMCNNTIYKCDAAMQDVMLIRSFWLLLVNVHGNDKYIIQQRYSV